MKYNLLHKENVRDSLIQHSVVRSKAILVSFTLSVLCCLLTLSDKTDMDICRLGSVWLHLE